jgi:hypothetical protein
MERHKLLLELSGLHYSTGRKFGTQKMMQLMYSNKFSKEMNKSLHKFHHALFSLTFSNLRETSAEIKCIRNAVTYAHI